MMWRLLLRNRTSIVGLALTGVLLLVAVFAPFIAPQDPLKQQIRHRLESPSPANLLGTDRFGRDVLSRIIYASRVSIGIGFGAAFLGAAHWHGHRRLCYLHRGTHRGVDDKNHRCHDVISDASAVPPRVDGPWWRAHTRHVGHRDRFCPKIRAAESRADPLSTGDRVRGSCTCRRGQPSEDRPTSCPPEHHWADQRDAGSLDRLSHSY